MPLFPLSRGSSHITSTDPSAKPTIDPKYYENPLDLEITTRLVMYFDTIVKAEPLSKLLKPGGRRSEGAPDLTNAEKVKDYVKAATLTVSHPLVDLKTDANNVFFQSSSASTPQVLVPCSRERREALSTLS